MRQPPLISSSMMVGTPWGNSTQLKERRLPPGPGATAEAAAENQRHRLFGAMVVSVTERGYGATRVADLSEVSGVSSRSFYNLFPGGKEECFLAVLDQFLSETVSALTGAGEGEGNWQQRLRAIYGCFAQMVAAQPAAANLVLIEAYAAGPAAMKELDQVTKVFERLSRKRLDESPERAGLPAAMIQAQVGALQELARTRLRTDEAPTLPSLVPELVDLISGYRAPPKRLRLSTRRVTLEPEPPASHEEAERAIRGFTMAVAERGYAGATIQEIARHGGMSANTFYAHFRDKRQALLATIDSSTSQLTAFAMAAYRRSPGWASGVRAMVGSALAFLSSRPATANVLLAEIYAGGSDALRLRARGLGEMTRVLDEGRGEKGTVPPIASEVIIAGIVSLARRQLLRKGAASLPSLAPIATYLALSPYVGPEGACLAANGDGRARPGATGILSYPDVPTRESKWVINSLLSTRSATEEEIAEELGISTAEVASKLKKLEIEGMVERIVPADKERPTEWTNTRPFRLIDGEDWSALTPEERGRRMENATKLTIADLNEALRLKNLRTRLDEHHTRLILELDEEGWTELTEIHRAAFNACQTVRMKSAKRLAKNGGEAITGRSMQLLFELPND